MSKYDILETWLKEKAPSDVEITIDALEEALGLVFPEAYRKYGIANDRENVMSKCFLRAGYKVSYPKRDKKTLLFTYTPSEAAKMLAGGEHHTRQHRIVKAREDVPTPCVAEVEKYLSLWDSLDNYVAQETALNKLFFETYPGNTKMEEVLIKVSCLNDFYYTNIWSTYSVALRILELDFDARLAAGDAALVEDVAAVNINGASKNFYSFATKYCSHHAPEKYAIYDSYVEEVLKYYRNVDHFAEFENDGLRRYTTFLDVLRKFAAFYHLEQYSLKDLDRYLWQLGKDKFPQQRYQGKSK